MTNNEQIAHNEYDMLQGNINRMFVCNTKEEFEKMHGWAKHRLEVIYKTLSLERGWWFESEGK